MKGTELTFERLSLLIYQHAAHLQASDPELSADDALRKAQALAVRAFDECTMRRGLTEASRLANVDDRMSRRGREPGGASRALTKADPKS